MGESVFEVVKQSVTVREAAELYGIAVGRGGMACCPFHDERHPSMKVDTRFHCFGCGADGDVIDFTARLYGLSPKEAAEKLAQDFGLAYDSKATPRRNYVRQKSETQARKEKREHGWRVLTDYYHLLRKWEADYSPKTPDEDPHPRFLEAIQKKDYMGYLLDTFLDSSTEEQDQWIAEHTAEISAIGRRVNIMADKPTNRERLQQITAGIEQGIKELFESEKYMRYLSVMSRFHRYSVNNTMLIYMQKPDATLVAGYNKWKNQFERHVKKGEHGITIIAPTPFKKKIEEQKLDPDTKAPILDAEGKAVMEEREVEIPMFRPVKVFDVSQTDGKPLPELASSLSGNVQNYEAFMEALRRSAPVPLSVEPMAANMDGYFSPDQQRIAIRAGMSEVQTVSAAVHEIAHSKLHNYAKAQEEAARAGDKEPPKKKDRNTEEVEAESISYAVCQYYGIQTGENSFGYIANWSQGKELPELRASLETINKAAGELIADIDRHYKVICKERGIDLTAQPEQAAPQQATEETPTMPEPSAEYREALLVLDDTTYLHVQPCDTGWDYTFYDAATRKQLDGGQLDAPELPLSTAALKICEMHGMGGQTIQYAPLSMIETLQEAAVQQMQTEAKAAAPETTQLPDAPEQHLDEYPMPDPALTQDDLEKCGYLDGDLLPLSKERAYELMERDLTVYIIQQGENPAMAFDTTDLDAHDGIFAVTREEWEESPAFEAQVKARMDHQQEREQAFLDHKGDCFAIYQVKHIDELRDIRYEGLEWLKSIGQTVQRDNYDLVYTAPLAPGDLKGSVLDNLEYRFNNEHPADYRHPSMSVSDIVAIKRDSKVSCHYCDSFGFAEVPGFLPDNPLKNTEMAVEDDYGMIDGIINNGPKEQTVAQLEQQARSGQPISLMDLAAAAHREDRDKKKSVVEQLKSQPPEEILKHTYEYTVREDILMAMEELDLPQSRAAALLASPSPLADVYKEFSDRETSYMDVVRDSIEQRAEAALDAQRELPLYRHDAAHAREQGDLDLYRASRRANIACKEAIEASISEHYRDNQLDKDAVPQVIEQFGYTRTLYVLANTVQQKDWDERFSPANKAWAKTVDIPPNPDGFGGERNLDFVVDSHSGLVDLFLSQARQDYLRLQPLTPEEIRAEAARLLQELRAPEAPNSPHGTHYMARVSPDFLARAGTQAHDRLMALLPFRSLAIIGMKDLPGTYVTILASEDRSKELRQRRPSVRRQLKQEPRSAEKKAPVRKKKEPER